MNKLLSFSLPVAIAAALTTSAIAQTATIPASQQQPPAGVDSSPYRPACSQLSAQVSPKNPAFIGWGVVADGTFAPWYGLPADMGTGEALKQLDSLGLCVKGGAIVPLSVADVPATAEAAEPVEDGDKTILQQRADRIKSDIEERKASGESNSGGGLILLALAAAGGYWWVNRSDGNDTDAPLPFIGSANLPQQRSRGRGCNLPPRHPEAPSEEDEPGDRAPAYSYSGSSAYAMSVGDETRSYQPAPTPAPAPELVEDSPTPKNPAKLMARRKRSTLITAKPRTGKSLSIANAWPEVQREGFSVAIVQPKYCAKEAYYWQGADRVFGFMLENWQKPEGMEIESDCSALIDGDRTEQIDKAELAKQLTKFLMEWRQGPNPNKLLIVDELRALKEVLPKWYNQFFSSFMVVEVSSGETAGRIVWVVSQSTSCKDIGFSGGDRSMFDLFALETPESAEHYHSIRRCFNGLPEATEDLYEYSQSPKNAIFYHSALNGWASMARLREAPAEGHFQGGSFEVTKHFPTTSGTSGGSGRGSAGSARYTRAELDSVMRVSGSGSATYGLVSAALDAIKEGKSKTHVIEQVLSMGGRRYEEGAAIYEQLKAAVDAA